MTAWSPHPSVPPEVVPDLSEIRTEDVAPLDNHFASVQKLILVESLRTNWRDPTGMPFFVACNVGVFHTVNEPPLVPDVQF